MDLDRIRQRAYEIWQQEGQPEGKQQEHWERAMREVTGDDARGGVELESGADGDAAMGGISEAAGAMREASSGGGLESTDNPDANPLGSAPTEPVRKETGAGI
ncbi:hypothetical protein N825_06460 [Skermanella stibiiresistens SB22]|uniref:DUF2934 domain-containing protein n=1 Tax=Skermanella stibiiresistens SB22 TaxID=1385369 RepID=W9H3N6_9PROT|nr:DUF2934 domain-containing protein [Skermanella stibiiresistens]EWY39342.1 hypothetical protein N825_06460 [Skermanella stibiiresistens SB22]